MKIREDEFPRSSVPEEIANSVTHGIAFVLSLVGSTFLIFAAIKRESLWWLIASSVYSMGLVSTFGASTLSHAVRKDSLKRLFRNIDQGVIYLMIAGTYTPFALAYFHGAWWWFLVPVWAGALSCCVARLISRSQRIGTLSMLSYLLLGWIPGMVIVPLLYSIPSNAVLWLTIGGLSYTVGTIFLALDERIPYGHTVWHLFVIAGSAFHYVAILSCTSA